MGPGKFIKNLAKRKPSKPAPSVPALREGDALALTGQLADNLNIIRQTTSKSSDYVIREIALGSHGEIKVALIFLDAIVDMKSVENHLMKPLLSELKQEDLGQFTGNPADLPHYLMQSALLIGEAKIITLVSEVWEEVLNGKTVLLFDGSPAGLSTGTEGWKERSISEPSTQTVIRGSREGFTESLRTNISMIRKKIKDPRLICDNQTVGSVTKTSIAVMYLEGIANSNAVKEVFRRLRKIDIDGIFESGNIEELIQDEAFSPFPTMYNSERPDVIAAGLLEGRIAIIVDGTPFVLLVPVLFIQFFHSAEDYYQRADIATLIRILRLICFFIVLLAPSLFIAITTFHQELLPSQLLISLASQREGVPFPAFIETLVMEITFEILREAGVRMPRAVGQSVSIVGALVIGQAAVEAGIISAAVVIVVAITAITSFVFPAQNFAIALRMLRFGYMFLAATFGLFGITVGLIGMVIHMTTLRSFGVPFLAPFAPHVLADQKDAIVRVPIWGMFARPRTLKPKTDNPKDKKGGSEK